MSDLHEAADHLDVVAQHFEKALLLAADVNKEIEDAISRLGQAGVAGEMLRFTQRVRSDTKDLGSDFAVGRGKAQQMAAMIRGLSE